jgi:hypothetical protein
MSNDDNSPEKKAHERTKKALRAVRRELALKNSFVLDRYDDPPQLDFDAALKASDQKTRFGQPCVDVFLVEMSESGPAFAVSRLYAKRPKANIYGSELDATIALRNMLARYSAENLLRLDRQIEKLRTANSAPDTAPNAPTGEAGHNPEESTNAE